MRWQAIDFALGEATALRPLEAVRALTMRQEIRRRIVKVA
jgi:hypothetical protein